MVHGVFNPQYQRYGKKILVGTDLKRREADKLQYHIYRPSLMNIIHAKYTVY
jgi:hypothetical protein